jgi:ketosteroid isomerase-like protein/tetratricopeptide (TPR) repeat protein
MNSGSQLKSVDQEKPMIAKRSLSCVLFLAIACAAASAQTQLAKSKASRKVTTVVAADALTYFRAKDWARAADAYKAVVATNPHDGQNWSNYGFSLHSLKRYEQAIKAFEKAANLGFRPEVATYNIACAHALLGHNEEALTWLRKALEIGFNQDELLRTDTDLDSLRDIAGFKNLLGAPPAGLSRAERWAFDLDYLVRRMEKVHYNLYAKVSREKLQAAVHDLKGHVGALRDEEIAVGVQSIVALVGDGHTVVVFEPRGKPASPRYPIDMYLYNEGLFVRGAASEFAKILGAQVLRIGNASAEEALRAVEPLCSRDNDMGIKLHSPAFLTNPAVLSYLKLTDDMSGASFAVKKTGGEEIKISLRPVAMDAEAAKRFVRANASANGSEPISFANNDDPFWFKHVPERKLVYFQYNAVANKPDETLEHICGRLFAFVTEHPVEYLVIDMRNNGGGNNFLNQPLVHGLIKSDKINRSGHLFVLIGRRTFSAAMNGAVDIERNTKALFVGEPTGSSPNFVGESTILVLPCSGLRLSCSSLYWQSSTATDRRTWISPSLVAEPSIAAFTQNRDPGLEAIFEYIDAHSDESDRPKSSRDSAANVGVKSPEAADVAWMRKVVDECNRQSIEAFKKGDMLAVARGYTDDATIYHPRDRRVRGRQAIDRMWQSVKGAKDWKLETFEVGGTKEAIFELGRSTLTTVVDGKESVYACDYVVIWKRQKDGTYRTYTDIYN